MVRGETATRIEKDLQKVPENPNLESSAHRNSALICRRACAMTVGTLSHSVDAFARTGHAGAARGRTPSGTLGEAAAVALNKSGRLWRGDDFDGLAEYIRHFQAGGYPIATVAESRCGECDGRAF